MEFSRLKVRVFNRRSSRHNVEIMLLKFGSSLNVASFRVHDFDFNQVNTNVQIVASH